MAKKSKKRIGRPPLLPHMGLKSKEILAGMLEVKPPSKKQIKRSLTKKR